MAHKIAKLILEHVGTFVERVDAIRAAIDLGMPLQQIEEYLDWLDAMRGPPSNGNPQDGRADNDRGSTNNG
jgi:DNA-binding transcriptional MerR regulator